MNKIEEIAQEVIDRFIQENRKELMDEANKKFWDEILHGRYTIPTNGLFPEVDTQEFWAELESNIKPAKPPKKEEK